MVAVFFVSLISLWFLKIALVLFVQGLQTDFVNEFNKMVSKALGVKTKDIENTPFWMKWLHELNPAAIREFKNRIVALESKIERQATDIHNQAAEKARKESQLIEAKKFKDLVHQVRHDLRQTVGVVRSSLELIPTAVNGREVLRGAVGSLDAMINDLKEREIKHSCTKELQQDLIEVIIAEAVREQQVAFSSEKIKFNFLMNNEELHFVSAPREELKRVITNLIVNAAEAIHDEGKIDVFSEASANEFNFKIVDNGQGFSEEAIKNLFKKGFTTKANGSGRGLSFTQKKIREWGGRLLVDSRFGKTIIEIALPVSKANHWRHPSIISKSNDIVFVDDYPFDFSKIVSQKSKSEIFSSLKAFTYDYKNKKIGLDSLIVFDLHLEEGLLATEILAALRPGQKYVFMTSDYLNPDLIVEAQKRQFLVIPKELVGFALMNGNSLDTMATNIAEVKGV
ncbi:MAG: HAMP domain-containing sensor histidine kinase [Patescibacteria group bacterium]